MFVCSCLRPLLPCFRTPSLPLRILPTPPRFSPSLKQLLPTGAADSVLVGMWHDLAEALKKEDQLRRGKEAAEAASDAKIPRSRMHASVCLPSPAHQMHLMHLRSVQHREPVPASGGRALHECECLLPEGVPFTNVRSHGSSLIESQCLLPEGVPFTNVRSHGSSLIESQCLLPEGVPFTNVRSHGSSLIESQCLLPEGVPFTNVRSHGSSLIESQCLLPEGVPFCHATSVKDRQGFSSTTASTHACLISLEAIQGVDRP
ncbi:unnamed protein product [Closterium sp. NIES-64]|nr:unnamed protein product [Closterium sp. NIES-64]